MVIHVRRSVLTGLAIGWLCGCNAVLGVEELKPARDGGILQMEQPNRAQDAGTSNAGSSNNAAGGRGAGSKAGSGAAQAGSGAATTAGAGGQGNPHTMATAGKTGGLPPAAGGGGTSHLANAGDAANSGAGTGGNAGIGAAGSSVTPAAGSGGDAAPSGNTVTGKVIDYWRHVLPNVSVRVGDKSTTTDAQGRFTLADVPSTYDVSLLVHTSINNSDATIAWQVQGLTRRDPTLQIYRGLPDRDAEILMHVKNVTFPLTSTQKIVTGWASADGTWGIDLDSMDTDYISPSWIGPSTSTGTAHALLFAFANSQGIPTEYLSHDAHPVAMVENMKSEVSFNLGGGAKLASGAISGSVVGSTNNQRINEVYLRFADDTSLQLVSDWQATNSFSYVVPSIEKATLTVVATNRINTGGEAAAYADNVSPNQTGLMLTIPNTPTLSAPGAAKTNVDDNTLFQWSSDAKVTLFCARADNNYDAMYVLTAKKEAKLPAKAAGFAPAANAPYGWNVEIHGDFASVDAASDTDGFLSAYSSDVIRGPRRGSGSYAESATRGFTTAP